MSRPVYQDSSGKRMNVEGDRLSSLPDDLIHKILSFIDTREAIETSVLSSRWRYIWTSMPCLSFSSEDLFSDFVTNVLSSRNNQTDVHSVNLAFRRKSTLLLVIRILAYAFSHNVQQLSVTCLSETNVKFLLSHFNSQSLKHLTLTGNTDEDFIMTTPTWELPALTTLDLHNVIFHDDNSAECVGLFSNCANLKNLTIKDCRLSELNGLDLCHPGLSSLTLENGYKGVNLVTPQLKSLYINNWPGVHLVSAPNLSSLHYEDSFYPLELSADLPHLEKVDICISSPSQVKANAYEIVCLLQRLHSVKFLTLNLELIEFLSSSVELISRQRSPFANLKSLKIYPADVTDEKQTEPKVPMSTEVKNYLLDGSPGATFTMVSHEEMRAMINFAIAQKYMRKFRVVLDKLKEKRETNTTDTESHMAQPNTEMKWRFGQRMAQIESYWEGLNEQMEKGYENAGCAISWLRRIGGVLAMLPTSHRDKLQARFSGLCVEVDTIMDDMLDHLMRS